MLAEASLSLGGRYFALHGNLPAPRWCPTRAASRTGGAWPRSATSRRCVRAVRRAASPPPASTPTTRCPSRCWPGTSSTCPATSSARDARLVDYRSEAMIRATRLLRPVLPAVHRGHRPSTPLRAGRWSTARPEIVLTANDSNRLLTFPNPETLDVPHLYASHADYLRISYDLVRARRALRRQQLDAGARPLRRRSGQPHHLDHLGAAARAVPQGLYAHDEHASLDDAERALLVENLCALVDLPMSRVEVRTDEGGDYARPRGRQGGVQGAAAAPHLRRPRLRRRLRLRRAGRRPRPAQRGRRRAARPRRRRRAPVHRRDASACATGSRATLAELAPLAEALGYAAHLEPLAAMADGAPNPAGEMRAWFAARLAGARVARRRGCRSCPTSSLREWLDERTRALARRRRARSPARARALGDEAAKLAELLAAARAAERATTRCCRCASSAERRAGAASRSTSGAVAEVIAARRGAGAHPVGDQLRRRAARRGAALRPLHRRDAAPRRAPRCASTTPGRYPAVVAGFPGRAAGAGHARRPLRRRRAGPQRQPVLAAHRRRLPVGPRRRRHEDRGRHATWCGCGAPRRRAAVPAGQPAARRQRGERRVARRTAPRTCCATCARPLRLGARADDPRRADRRAGDERLGQVCVANRGVVRLRLVARGERGHTAFAAAGQDLARRAWSRPATRARRAAAAPPDARRRRALEAARRVPVPEGRRDRASTTSPPTRACSGSRCGRSPRTTSPAARRGRAPRVATDLGLELVPRCTRAASPARPTTRTWRASLAAVEQVARRRGAGRPEARRHLGALRARRQRRRLGADRDRPARPQRAPLHPVDRALPRRASTPSPIRCPIARPSTSAGRARPRARRTPPGRAAGSRRRAPGRGGRGPRPSARRRRRRAPPGRTAA